MVLSVLAVPWKYEKDHWGNQIRPRVEAGSNTFTVALRVVGEEK
jgi:hypothetical protein